ncbi:MAG: alkaline phosphatase family protein [Deltaproteobacteria bacterium]|nr:alkaline phosphatase family protein [Deltaproteobacteria bacterium]
MNRHTSARLRSFLFLCTLFSALFVPQDALAYVGPGAGFAFIGSGFVFILTLLLALVTISFWPLQWAWRKATGKRISKNARTRRVVVLGLDGLEPSLVDKFISEGKLPNLKSLSENGSYKRLGTTLPALSPVAWSSFQTGVNPGAHNIFDFLTRDKRLYLPNLSSTDTELPPPFKLFGRWKIAFRRPKVRLLRKSQPFWKILGKHGIFSNVIRVPISYPPEKFFGNVLSAMCTPDLRGTQGEFTVYTTASENRNVDEGEIKPLKQGAAGLEGDLIGPPHPSGEAGKHLTARFTVKPNSDNATALLTLGDTTVTLKVNEFSEWMNVDFRFGRSKISGICRFCLRELSPDVNLYVSPINIDPVKPALPISSPVYFSTYIAKKQGSFGTLGLMEDTWGRNELALDDQRFLDQTYLTHSEREEMFLNMLDKTREGVCICVFDASDRIQHMFWRYMDKEHPSPLEDGGNFERVIPEMYEKMDELVGNVHKRLNDGDVLIVMSDHGFASFRRCININTWLIKEGYLVLKDGVEPGPYLQGVDWTRTKAFALGLAGIYLNRTGREASGTVSEQEAVKLKAEITSKLKSLRDPQGDRACVREVYDTSRAYRGLYAEEAPDLIVGYEPGYRVSWDSVKGVIEPEVFSDNLKAWSGDHHVDPECVPGVLFINRKVEHSSAHIVDIAPTILDLFSVPVPPYMEGKVLL